MKVKSTLLAFAVVMLLGAPAFAQEDAAVAVPADQFTQLDANADGALSPEEFTDAEAFKAADADADGTVTKEEWDAAQAPAEEVGE